MTTDRLTGVVAAIPTPITAAGEPDHGRIVKLARHLLDNGCDGLNLLGTTGEATSFTAAQRMSLMTAVAESGLPLSRFMVGTGAAAVGDAMALSRHAAQLGYAGALLLPPFYYKNVTDKGIIDYVIAVAGATTSKPIPLYLYNFPALSGVAYTVRLVENLVERLGPRIAGLKDSSGDLAYARAVAGISTALDVFPSNEASLIEARSGTFAGCISATANLNSAECARAFHQGDTDALAHATSIRALFEGYALIPGIKLLLSGIHGDPALSAVKPPLEMLSNEEAVALQGRYNHVIKTEKQNG